MKIYGISNSRWVRPVWTARELDLPFEPVVVSISKGQTRTPEYRAIHPFAKVPALEDGDVTLFESMAICNYLAAKRPEVGLIPADGTAERRTYDQWVSFVISDLDQPLGRILRHLWVYPEARRSAAEIDLAREDFRRLATALEPILPDTLVGDRFTVADIFLTYTLKWASDVQLLQEDLLVGYPRLQAYVARHEARPAFPRELYP